MNIPQPYRILRCIINENYEITKTLFFRRVTLKDNVIGQQTDQEILKQDGYIEILGTQ